MKQLVSEASKHLIRVMLEDPRIAEKVFENCEDKEKYKICTINDSGTVIMGKTSCRWWNNIIKCQDKLQFVDFALRVWSALVDLSSGLNNEAIKEGLSHEIIQRSVRDRMHDFVVNRLFDCWRHVAQNSSGYQKPVDSSEEHRQEVIVQREKPREIILNINGKQNVIPILDSIGEPINLGVEFGVTGVTTVFDKPNVRINRL